MLLYTNPSQNDTQFVRPSAVTTELEDCLQSVPIHVTWNDVDPFNAIFRSADQPDVSKYTQQKFCMPSLSPISHPHDQPIIPYHISQSYYTNTRSLRRADHSYRGVLPIVVRRWVSYKNLVNEAPTQRGLSRQKQTKTILIYFTFLHSVQF